jgi:hypothetical protein
MEPGFACPVCRAVTTLAIIEPHPTRRGLAIHIAAYAGPAYQRRHEPGVAVAGVTNRVCQR